MRSVIDALRETAITQVLSVPSGPYLDMGRNDGTKVFLEATDCDFMLTVDTDIAFTPEDVTELVAAAEEYHATTGVYPVVAGTYFGVPKGVHSPIAYRRKPKDGLLYPISIKKATHFKHPLLTVDAAGTGFLLTHRSTLLEFLPAYHRSQQWFACLVEENTVTDETVWYGEDLMFCKRAAALGHPILLHRGVQLTHFKMMGLKYEPCP